MVLPDLVFSLGILDVPYFTLDNPPLSGEDIYIFVKSEGGGAPDDGTGGTRSLIVDEPTEEVRHCRWCGLLEVLASEATARTSDESEGFGNGLNCRVCAGERCTK